MLTNYFLPTTKKELQERGHKTCDIILITGDAYVDHPSFGAALIGRYLESLGYTVGIIAQPDWTSDDDFLKLGTPKLFVGITAGNLDSMLAHYTANKKLRSDDAYTPGNTHGKRPNRATIVYTNKIKHLMPGMPVVIGGIEASMRRLSHYDYWSDTIRKSILLDSKADVLIYGMGERQIKAIAEKIAATEPLENIPGTVIAKSYKNFSADNFNDYLVLPGFTEVSEDKDKFIVMTQLIEHNLNPYNAKTLIQEHDKKYVIVYPPALPLATTELDQLYDLNFTRKPHFSYRENIPAFDMIKDSITIVRGCAGGCTFCSLSLHQGKIIQSRSQESILNEIKLIAGLKNFSGVISDLGGPTANLYSLGCKDQNLQKQCKRSSCLHPEICKNFNTYVEELVTLMQKARKLHNIKKINISSGIRFDVALKYPKYIQELIQYHVPGHLKIAPEHFDDKVLNLMRKPSFEIYKKFAALFYELNTKFNRKQFILPYLISSFPGCSMEEMDKLEKFLKQNKIKVEQAQDFIPLPMTTATAMYYTEKDVYSQKKIYVAKTKKERDSQRRKIFWWQN